MKLKGKVWKFRDNINAWGICFALLAVSLAGISYLYAADDSFFNENNTTEEQTVTLDNNHRYSLSVWGRYSMLNMKSFNDDVEYYYADYVPAPTYDKPKNGYEVGLDLGYKITPNLRIGPRVSYLMVSAKNVYTDSDNTSMGSGYYWTYEEKQEYHMTLIPILLGGEYFTKYNDKFSYNFKLYLGYGLARMKLNTGYGLDSNY
jgi:hypothetical protein